MDRETEVIFDLILKARLALKAVCIVLLISCICFVASAEYVIVPHSEDMAASGELVNSEGADGTLTFWELPLYFKLIAIGCFLSVWPLSFLKILPFMLGKVRHNKGENNRQRILSYVSDNPGCAESDILKALGMKRGTFRYHAGKLKLANMLVSFRKGRFTRYFLHGLSVDSKTGFLNLDPKNETRKSVLETIFEEPGVTGKDLSSKLGVDKSTIHWHVNRLNEENVIRCEKHGKFKRYYPENNLKTGSSHRIALFPK